MNSKIINPYNKTPYHNNKHNGVLGRGATFNALNGLSCYRRSSLIIYGTNYKGFRIVICKRVLSIE